MGASFYPCAWHLLTTARGLLDRIIAWSVFSDAACQNLGRFLRKELKDRLPDTPWNVKFQLTVIYRDLALIGDLDRILAILLESQREFLAFDLLESSCGKEVEHHILRAHDLRIC
jgi:hypothetical protein